MYEIALIEPAAPAPLDPRVAAFVHAASAANTRLAYQKDLQRFLAWGGVVPATPAQVAAYLAAHAASHAPASLGRWLVSLGRAHTTQGLVNPCQSELVRTTLRGIRRQRGMRQRQVAPAVRDEVLLMVSQLGDSLRDCRDRALLLVGFAGALRRSELVALTTANIAFVDHGMTLTVRRSKTDQQGQGRTLGVPWARGKVCPTTALRAWLERSGGLPPGAPAPIFRAIDQHGHLASRALTPGAVALIVKRCAAAIGLLPDCYSGHSLRAGFCTTAAIQGAPHWKIKKVSGHKSNAVLDRYIRAARLFEDSPLEGMF